MSGLIPRNAPRMVSDEPSDWLAVRSIYDLEGRRRVVIERSEGLGLYRYCTDEYFHPCEEDEGVFPDGFWQGGPSSGLFASDQLAEKEARMVVKWISD